MGFVIRAEERLFVPEKEFDNNSVPDKALVFDKVISFTEYKQSVKEGLYKRYRCTVDQVTVKGGGESLIFDNWKKDISIDETIQILGRGA